MAFRQAQKLFRRFPLMNNMVVVSTLYYTGDVSRQVFQGVPKYEFDNAQKMAAYGGFVAAPIMFYWYQFLDAKLPGVALKTVLKKAVIDQTIVGFGLGTLFYICKLFIKKTMIKVSGCHGILINIV